jgi:hypothetical protein
MKDQGDWAFCMGINRLIYHTFAHKPFPDKYRPGMTMGPYGVHWDRGQTWWTMAKGYHKYISRCQYILSQGNSVADILYLTPEGAPQVFLPPESALEGTKVMPDKRGYSFDGCSPLFLMKHASVKDGRIVFPGGGSYRIMVLPHIQTMTPELVKKIGSLIESGATIIGNPPVKSPSLVNYPECDEQVKKLTDNIWGPEKMSEGLTLRRLGNGNIWWGEKLMNNHPENSSGKEKYENLYPDYQTTITLLKSSGIVEDFSSSGNIRYTHRSLPDRDIYFISNRTGLTVSDTCTFRDASLDAELWNPVTGEVNSIDCSRMKNKSYTVPVMLDAFQSFFVVFYRHHETYSNNIAYPEKFSGKQTLFTLEGSWDVAFDTTWGGPGTIVFDSLTDWSKRKEDGIRYYSGIAVYSKTFDLPEYSEITKNTEYFLDLGTIKNLGKIKLNKKEMGIIWTAPWQINITKGLKKKHNHLEIEVANLWINRLIGDESQPWDGIKGGNWPEWLLNGSKRESKRFTFTTHHFYKKDDPLAESGLIGPVNIKIVKKYP